MPILVSGCPINHSLTLYSVTGTNSNLIQIKYHKNNLESLYQNKFLSSILLVFQYYTGHSRTELEVMTFLTKPTTIISNELNGYQTICNMVNTNITRYNVEILQINGSYNLHERESWVRKSKDIWNWSREKILKINRQQVHLILRN